MKIFNWIVGSFCRTLGRFLFYIAIGLLAMLFISGKVHAATYWGETNIPNQYLNAYFYDWTSSSSYSLLNDTSGLAATYPNLNDLEWRYLKASSDFTVSTNGVSLVYNFGTALKTGYLYNINTYLCSEQDSYVFSNVTSSLGTYNTQALSGGTNYSYTTYTQLNPNPFLYSRVGFYSCVVYNSLVVPSFNSTYLGLRFKSPNNAKTGNYYFLGFGVEELGIYSGTISDSIDEIIADSGLASASSVEEVQTAVNDVKTELNDVNSSLEEQTQQQQQNHQETMNTITSTDSADLGALENSAGWLPAGPVDSILNLPLSLLNNLTSNLSKSCQPVILPIPYVNKDLTLPCVNTLYDDMGISGWVTTIGVIASAFIMFSYLLKLYKWVDDTLSFRENNQIDNWGGI